MSAVRKEKDSLGFVEVPERAYYGAQTARAVENYPISGMRAHPLLIRAFGMVKRAAAEANKTLGLISDRRADAIIQAAQEVIEGKWNDEFVVDVFQAGAGVSLPHEHQRGARQPRQRDPRRQARRIRRGSPQRPRQLRPVHQRRLPYRHARRHAAGARDALSRARQRSPPPSARRPASSMAS